MKTWEVTAKQMLKEMQASTGVLHRWEAGFWCTTPQPVTFEWGDAPLQPWMGSVAFQQLVAADKIKVDPQSGEARLFTKTPPHLTSPSLTSNDSTL